MRIRLVAHNRDEVKGGKVFWCRVHMTVRLEWINVQTTSDCLTRVASAILSKISIFQATTRIIVCALYSIAIYLLASSRHLIYVGVANRYDLFIKHHLFTNLFVETPNIFREL